MPRVETFADGALGWQVRRDAFDRVLVREAARAGATIVRPAIVRDASLGTGPDGTSIVEYEQHGGASRSRPDGAPGMTRERIQGEYAAAWRDVRRILPGRRYPLAHLAGGTLGTARARLEGWSRAH